MPRIAIFIVIAIAAAVPAAAAAQATAPTPPAATTGGSDTVTQTSANLNGTVDPNGSATTYHFEYGTSTAYGLRTPETAAGDGADPVAVKAAVQNLTRDTTYHYRLVATNAAGVARGADRTFHTAPGPRAPTVRSTTARDVGSRGARLTTRVDPNGQQTSVRFEYGRTTRYGASTDSVSAGSGDSPVPVSIMLGNLSPHTLYHFRAIATNATGTARSLDHRFRAQREFTGVSISLTPSRVLYGRGLTVLGRVAGAGVSGTRVALERQEFPFQAGFTEVATTTARSTGSFQFNIRSLFVTTRLRAVTRTSQPVASPVRVASSALRVAARGRSRGRRRARIEGSIWPQVPSGRVLLQRRSRRGHWAVVRRAPAIVRDANRSRYRFTVRRNRRSTLYRVVAVARDGGAHVPGRSRQVRVRGRRG